MTIEKPILQPAPPASHQALAAEAFKQDPRVAQAFGLLREALLQHRESLAGIHPPDPARAAAFAERLKRFQELRGAALYFPYISSGFGSGPLVELLDGSVKYDFITGIGVHYFGHASELMLKAGFESALEDTLMQGNLQQNADSEEVLRLLLGLANGTGANFAHGFLTSSGAMANENALKAMFQKRFPARRILAFDHNFAGRTLALSQVTDKPAYRIGLPPTLTVDYLPYFDPEDASGSTQRAVAALEEHLARHPGDHAAFVLELIQGEGGGYREGDARFFKALLEKARAAKVGILFDEIQTFGRTEQPFAFQHFGLEAYADVVTIGKLTQVCATLFTADYKPGPGLVSQTFTAATSALKAGHAVLQAMNDGTWFGPQGKIVRLSECFRDRLRQMAKLYPERVAGPFGMGAMVAFTPWGGDEKRATALLHALFHAGVIGFVAGSRPTRIRFLLPLGGVTEGDIDQACDIIEKTVASSPG
jgi:4-aminobutyrate aminotransferase-like enzyme